MQVQDAACIEALQTVCFCVIGPEHRPDALFSSFELGGEKKTKGAALQFVCHCSAYFIRANGVCSERIGSRFIFSFSLLCIQKHMMTCNRPYAYLLTCNNRRLIARLEIRVSLYGVRCGEATALV